MTGIDPTQFWISIGLLAIGTFGLRFSFLGLLGDRDLPSWAMRLLKFVPVTVLPALSMPLVVWPSATGGEPDPVRLIAAAVTVAVGLYTRKVMWALAAGIITLVGGLLMTL